MPNVLLEEQLGDGKAMSSEVWKPIAGYEGLYEVSNQGRVRSLKGKQKIRKFWKINRGYMSVRLSKNGKSQTCLVHRLVAATFCNKPEGCDVVNHIDNNPLNNQAENLEWVTQKRNVHHAASVGLMTIRPVIGSDGKTEVYYQSLCEVEKDGFTKSCVCSCCKGELKSHKGFTWRYANG